MGNDLSEYGPAVSDAYAEAMRPHTGQCPDISDTVYVDPRGESQKCSVLLVRERWAPKDRHSVWTIEPDAVVRCGHDLRELGISKMRVSHWWKEYYSRAHMLGRVDASMLEAAMAELSMLSDSDAEYLDPNPSVEGCTITDFVVRQVGTDSESTVMVGRRRRGTTGSVLRPDRPSRQSKLKSLVEDMFDPFTPVEVAAARTTVVRQIRRI